ncbi:hypothetical protein C8R48DRAFT_597241 [Suillus tomentosus]|nr:hypothetical protein C8R48DRAFT_597241 [Suillus tomentosus]
MPKVCSEWWYCRHFKPLTIHCEFPPERGYSPPPLMQHQVFSCDTDSLLPDGIEKILPVVPLPSKIPKLRGEVSCLSQSGYNLQETLGWPASEYEKTGAFVSQLAREYLKVHKS